MQERRLAASAKISAHTAAAGSKAQNTVQRRAHLTRAKPFLTPNRLPQRLFQFKFFTADG